MDDQAYRYAEEMMLAHKKSKVSSDSLETKLIQLNNAVSLTASHCLSPDYCPAVTTQKRGIVGKAVVLAKRLARKATFFIVKDLAQEISAFQTESVNALGGIIALQEDILIELMRMKQSVERNEPASKTAGQDRTEGDRT